MQREQPVAAAEALAVEGDLDLRVVVLSGLPEARAEDDRIAAFVTKDASFGELEDVLRRVVS